MSLRFLSSLNKPPIVTAAGAIIAGVFPFIPTGALSIGALQALNILSFAVNVKAVTVPGRLDGGQQAKMQTGDVNPASEGSALLSPDNDNDDSPLNRRDRSLLLPAGWAFSIWAPIYLGEAVFCVAQFASPSVLASLPQATVPFVTANLLQSLWCASFRPEYNEGWNKYVSCAMLGGTACALSQIPYDLSWFYLPMVMHFGWTTAATLVNVNGSISMEDNVSNYAIVAAGHASVVAATVLGVTVTVFEWSSPAYGLTLAWALAAVANGVAVQTNDHHWSDSMQTGAHVQKLLCVAGSVLCATAAALAIAVE